MMLKPVLDCQRFSDRKIPYQMSGLTIHCKGICLSIPFCIKEPYRKQAVFYLSFICHSNLFFFGGYCFIAFNRRPEALPNTLFHSLINSCSQIIRLLIIFIRHISGKIGQIKLFEINIIIRLYCLHHRVIDPF